MQRQIVEPFDLPYFPGIRKAYVILRSLGHRASYAMEIAKAWEFLDARKDEVAIVTLHDDDFRIDVDEECFSNKRQFQAYKKDLENGFIEAYGIGIAYKEGKVWEPDYSTFVWGYETEIDKQYHQLRTAIFERMPEFEAYIKEQWANESCL